jgi:epoxyqueuosine reductase QueG
MNCLNHIIETELAARGAKLICFVDVSHLSAEQNRGLSNAIVFALPLTPAYIQEVADAPDYVAARVADNFNFDDDEYLLIEIKAGTLSDEVAGLLVGKGYQARSQSDQALLADGMLTDATHTSVLPNKTIAVMGGAGWIGRNNLFITPEYGAAQCLGTVLTDAPLEIIKHEPLTPKCGNCTICVDICERQVLKGVQWSPAVKRDEIVNVYECSTCLKCLIHCSRTQKYMRNQ